MKVEKVKKFVWSHIGQTNQFSEQRLRMIRNLGNRPLVPCRSKLPLTESSIFHISCSPHFGNEQVSAERML
jgi:hypothetical protein